MPGAWRCEVCGYVHDGAEPPERCPVCGASRDRFVPVALGIAPASAAPPAVEGDRAVRIVILGGGVAGVTAAGHARATAPKASVTLVSDEPVLPYVRLDLTRLLAGEVEEHALALQPEAWYDEQRIERVQGSAGALRRGARLLILEDGRSLPYDRLVLACGAQPFRPPVPGLEGDGVYTLRTLADARRLLAAARPGLRVACIGGGLLGLETAGALARRGCAVTVLEGSAWLLPRQLAEPAGRVLERHVEGAGIGVRSGVRVTSIERGADPLVVHLAEGAPVGADCVVVAAGIRPEVWIARQAGLQVRRGVIVDDRMTTSDPAVLAAGDVAEHAGVVYGIWPAAWAQGAVAGVVAAGGEAAFPGMAPSTRLKVLHVDVFSAGVVEAPDATHSVHEEDRDGVTVRLVVADGRLAGATVLGDPQLATLLLDVLQAGTPVLESPPLLERFPALRALGGAQL
ncbi:MAG: FAD-dependent oxidoreductase [Deltaproteobacteria bacterium]|nr:FAD-dependent oxidoreductase [Deltaproteobacteria bacterium]